MNFHVADIVLVGEGDEFGIPRVGELGEEALAGTEMDAGMRGLDAAAGAEAGVGGAAGRDGTVCCADGEDGISAGLGGVDD